MKEETKSAIEWVINNIDRIPEEFIDNYDLDTNEYVLLIEEEKDKKEVCWLLDREDGTAGDYETSKERLGVRKDKNIVWGFSSGCSCWSGWGLKEYSDSTYKQFILKDIIDYNPNGEYWSIKSKEDIDLCFSRGWENEIILRVEKIMESIR